MVVEHYEGVSSVERREALYELYRKAYAGRPPEVTREALDEHEFHRAIGNPSSYAWVVWDDTAPRAMLLAETRLERSPWINPEYLARQFPNQSSTERVAYVTAIVVDPDSPSLFSARRCLAAATDFFARAEMVVVFDVTDHLQDEDLTGGMAGAVQAITKRHDTPVELVGITRYYVADFSRESA